MGLEGLASRLGLTLTSTGRMVGALDGQAVEVGRTEAGYVVIARWIPPLDLGLRLGPQGLERDLLRNLRGPRDVALGDQQLDDAFCIGGDDPARTRALFTAPSLRSALLALQSRPGKLSLSDEDCRFHLITIPGIGFPDDRIADGIDRTIAVARAVGEARAPLAAAPPLVAEQALWSEQARAWKGVATATPLSLAARVGDVEVSASFVREAQSSFGLKVAAAPQPPLGAGLKIETRAGFSSLASRLAGGSGARRFDARISARVARKEGLAAIVGDAARRRLLELADAGCAIRADDDRLVVHRPSLASPRRALAAGDALRIVVAAVEAVQELRDGALPRLREGPYR